jgi:anti-sigma factor RsiW
MKHGITTQQWDAYSEGELSPQTRDQLEAHLLGCYACWNFYVERKQTTELLRAAGAAVRDAVVLREGAAQQGLQAVLARVQSAETVASSPLHPRIRERLADLSTLLTLLCGAQMAERVLTIAALGSPAQSLTRVTLGTWEPFLHRLTALARFVGGETGADLIWESGQIR